MTTKRISSNSVIVFLTVALTMLLSATQLKAQSPDTMAAPEERTRTLTDKMKEKLPLADSIEYQKVYDINLKYTKKMSEAFKNADSKMAKFKAIKSVQKEKDKELKSILSKAQYKNYEAMMDEAKQRMKSEFRNRRT